MKHCDGYKDLCQIVLKDLPKTPMYCHAISDDPFKKDKNLRSYIKDFSATKPISLSAPFKNQKHPRYALVRIGKTIEPQVKLSEYVYKKFGDKIVSITYNGGDSGISLRGKKLPKNILLSTPNGEKFSESKEGVHTFKNCHIGSIIEYLQSLGVEKIPRIMVFAGVLADRGISFGACNYTERLFKNLVPWHLTELYFVASRTTNLANCIQIASRICGVFPDKIPLCIYSNACEDIRKCYHLQKELLERSVKRSVDEKEASTVLTSLPISSCKIPKNRKVISGLKKVNDDIVYGGYDWSAENKNHIPSSAEFSNGDRPSDFNKTLSEDEINKIRNETEKKAEEMLKNMTETEIKNGTDYIKRLYKNKSGYIYKIISKFIDCEFESLSATQIKDGISEKLVISNYDRWDIKHNRYKLLEEASKGRYNICSNIVEALDLLED